tara:strand:+ start:745 stop:900 length:156 start_codon:yes stop_codon:yes gene_type:complete
MRAETKKAKAKKALIVGFAVGRCFPNAGASWNKISNLARMEWKLAAHGLKA